MCGIAGCSWPAVRLVQRMNQAIKHRGPDDYGVEERAGVTLGHVRLAIIDLSRAGHQPMFYQKQDGASSATHRPSKRERALVSIVFNGEIYNYQELREELEKRGYNFATKTDTEVILASYLEWGPACVKRFNGMWAFVIHDQKKRLLFCSRDRLGQKPFYYALTKKGFIFSSELKGLLQYNLDTKCLDTKAIELYFALGYIPAPWTIYKEGKKLEAAHNLVFDLRSGAVKMTRYWDLPKHHPINDRQLLVKEGRALLKDATRLRMIADVPVGAFLSGGLDSSATVGEMRELTDASKLHTFSIGFEGKYDETKYINIVKEYFGTVHHHAYFKEKDFEQLITTYATIYDEPFGDFSGFPTYKVSEMAKEHVTVCLSGDGGDEIFGGYTTHQLGSQMDLLRKIPKPLRWMLSKGKVKENLNSAMNIYFLKEAMKLSLKPLEEFYASSLDETGLRPLAYKRWTIEKLRYSLKRSEKLGEALRTHDALFNTLSDHFLVKVDRASMAHALEVRSPFLDYRLLEWAQRIPTRWKASPFKTKILMRDIIKGIVPEAIIKRGKQGFTPPLEEWIRKRKYEKVILEALEIIKNKSEETYFFYKNTVLKKENKVYNHYKIRLFLFGLWAQEWGLK